MKTIYFIASEPKELSEANCNAGFKKIDTILNASKRRYYNIKYWPNVTGKELLQQTPTMSFLYSLLWTR